MGREDMTAKKTILRNFETVLEGAISSYSPAVVKRVEGDVMYAQAEVERKGLQVIYSGARSDLVRVESAGGSALTRSIPITIVVIYPDQGKGFALTDSELLDDVEDTLLTAFDDLAPSDVGDNTSCGGAQDSGEIRFTPESGVIGRFVYLEIDRST